MKKVLSLLLAVLMVIGTFPMTAFAAEIPDGLGILALSEMTAFEEGETIEYSKWGMEGYSTQSYIVTVPAGTETVKVTFDPSNVPAWSGNISGGWLTYDAENDSYDMGGKDLVYEESNGGYTITLDVKSMIENGNYYVKYDSYYWEMYALGFKYGEAAGDEEIIPDGTVIVLSADVEKISVGDKFKVTATLSGNEGFAAMTLKLNWNNRNVEFLGFDVVEEDGEEFLDSEVFPASYNPVYNQEKGTIAVARSKNSTKNGVMFVANFEVVGNGETGIGLKKDYPDFLYKTADGEDVEVYISEKDIASLGARIAAESVTLDKTEVSLEEGSSVLIKATVTPADASDPVVFASSDETVATVTSGGNIKGVKPGTATITVTAGDVSAECAVTVTPEENIIRTSKTGYSDFVDSEMTGVKSINYKGEALEIRNLYKVTIQGHEDFYLHNSRSGWSSCFVAYKLDGTHFGGDASWGSDFSKATFNGSGYQTREIIVSYDEVKAAVGEENIGKLGISEEDKLAFLVFEKVSATFDYAVLFVIEPVELEGISIDETAEIDKGESKDFKVTVIPSGAEAENVTWKSSDESVATVDENGKVTAVENGTATITATAGEFSDTCEVTVRTQIKGIPSNGSYSGNVTNITVAGVVVDNYVWEDKTVTVYVDKDTTATATVKIYWFHSYNQGATNTYEVEIKNGEGLFDDFHEYGDWVIKFAPTTPTTILTVESEATIVKGYEKTLTATRNEDSTDEMSWSSSDESVATVDKNGKVRGISEGKATITVKSGDLEASCEVTVILVHAESVTIVGDGIENGKLRILKGKQIQLSEVTEPAEHTDEITWSSSNTEVLSVLEWAPGYFNAKAPGTATVTVTVGEVSDSIEVEVYEAPVEKITLDKTEATILNIETLVLNATTDPEEHTDGNIEWSSSDETVVTAAMGTYTSGNITPVGVGEATVTAKIGNVSATCKVTVKEPEEGTVLWSYDGNSMNGWPQHMSSSYGIGALVMNGTKFDSVAEENGVYTVTLPHATAKDAEISLKAYACGMSPQNLGVNWNDDPENKLNYTFNLTDGEASVKIRAYKAQGPGASREGTKTFNFVIGGECTFDQEVAEEKYLASEATCTEAATYYKSCLCGEAGTETFSYGEALGHDEIAHEAKEATCTEIGWDEYVTCSRCDYTTYSEIAALGHDEISHEGKEATCTEAGWAEYVTCSRCDYTTYDEIEALGHDMAEATCTEAAKCRRCDHTEGEALGHSYKYETVKEPTCTEAGERKITCEHCDYEETEAIEALGHDWGAWETVKPATYTEEGLMERVCEICGEKETKVIPKLAKPSDKPNPGVTDILPGDKAEEVNPGTGAPVAGMTAGIAVLAAALAVFGKKRR